MKLKRVYHPYDQWEEVRHNMWGGVLDRGKFLRLAIKFTSNHIVYGRFMMRVVHEWPISCENALTDYLINRRAWLGHAACALAHEIPEDIVRLAWGELSNVQQLLANKKADEAIQAWEHAYIKSKNLHKSMGKKMLP